MLLNEEFRPYDTEVGHDLSCLRIYLLAQLQLANSSLELHSFREFGYQVNVRSNNSCRGHNLVDFKARYQELVDQTSESICMAIGVLSDPASRWGAPSGTSWSQNTPEISFKPVSKWRLLRSIFNCTRIWRDVGRESQSLRVRYTVDLQFTSIEVMQVDDLANSQPRATDDGPKLNIPAAAAPPSAADEDTQQFSKPQHSAKHSQGSMQFLIPLVVLALPECTRQQWVLSVVASAVLFLSFEGDQYRTDWGGWETNLYLVGAPLESKVRCVSIVTLFQAASILLFQAAYFWLKFREALLRLLSTPSSSGRKRKLSGDEDALRGVYARPVKGRDGHVVGHKYEPRFKPPREWTGNVVQSFQNLSLGSYGDRRDAEVVRQIAAFYYGLETELVSLGDGRVFRIPAHHGPLSGLEKAKWVAEKAKELFELYCKPSDTTFTSQHLQPGAEGRVYMGLNVGDEAIQVDDDPSPLSGSLNYNQASTDASEELSPMQGIAKFLLEDLEDVALGNTVTELQPSIDLAYPQRQPLVFAGQTLDCSTPCSNTTRHDRQGLSNGIIQLESSEAGAAISCKRGQDALTSDPAHDSGWNDFPVNPTVLSPQQQRSNDVTASQLLSSFCSKNCITDLLLKMVSLQQQQIKEMEREIELLKGASKLKCSCHCNELFIRDLASST